MHRTLLLSILLCLNWSVWGQTYDYRYWFDTDELNQRRGTSTTSEWHIDADLSGLNHTFHSIHVQVKDSVGRWSAPITRYFIKQPDLSLYNGYYWFDDNIMTKRALPVSSGKLDIDVSALDNKVHYAHFQYADNQNNTTIPLTKFFLKLAKQGSTKFHYWTDNNTENIRTSECNGEVLMLNMTDEDDGFHVLYLQGEMDGCLTHAQSRMFIKVPQTEGGGELTCLCYVDGDLYKQEKVASKGGIIDWTLDVTSLSNGFHRILVQVVTPSGAATSVHESFFFRTTMTNELSKMKLVYNVDGGEYITQAGDFGTGIFHFDLDVSALNDGLHRLNYMLMSETGTSTRMNTSFFIKTPLGGPGIANYKYWINNYQNEAVKVTLDKRQEILNLISLLPLKSYPIRSSCFHFEIAEDGTPMMYAKNDFHIQFVDVKHYHLDAVRQYIDYNIGQPIENITPLESGKRVWNHVPNSNQVHWFQVEAVKGDSLSLKTDMACTLKIFSPTGKEVFTASGVETVKYDGCHAEEDGTYYVALHDVTGTKSKNIALDFQLIDKYAILRWDVSTVGNGGASSITYEGNGFNDLYAIDYVNTSGDTIKCNYKDYVNDVTATATTDFSGASVGMYDAVFHFTTEDRIVKNALKVEEAKNILLKTNLKYPSTYLRGTSVTYELTVENRGNMTAYKTPIFVYIETPKKESISRIDIDGLNLPNFLEGISSEGLTDADYESIKDIANQIDDDHYFLKINDTNDFGDSVCIRTAYFFVNLPPLSKKEIKFSIFSDEKVAVYVSTPDDWFATLMNPNVYSTNRYGARSIKDTYCCYQERIECIAEITADVAGVAGKIAGFVKDVKWELAMKIAECAASYINNIVTITGYTVCGKGDINSDTWEQLNASMDAISLPNTLAKCAMNFLDSKHKLVEWAKNWEEFSQVFGIHDIIVKWGSCYEAFTTKKPGCPPVPPTGGSSTPVNSYDPNDIYGYQAESGSKAIRKNLKELYYTIEFENDTAFATASAQNVYLTDTLDAKYFDLKSFEPTSLEIGDKMVELDGNPNFVTTVDMRPAINAIAQVKCDYDNQKGIAKWHFSSLDPMTMEPVTYVMDGFLPINNSEGDGIGRVSFNINLRDDFEDGTEISNKAYIVFDSNEAIITPTWTNVVDTIAPQSRVVGSELVNDTTITLRLSGTDNHSGVWKYDLYVKMGNNASWFKFAENVVDSVYRYTVNNEIDYHFCVVATDSAGNVEPKMLQSECEISAYTLGDANNDKVVDAADIVLAAQWFLGQDVDINWNATNVEKDDQIDAADIVGIAKIYLSTSTIQRVKPKRMRRTLWKE